MEDKNPTSPSVESSQCQTQIPSSSATSSSISNSEDTLESKAASTPQLIPHQSSPSQPFVTMPVIPPWGKPKPSTSSASLYLGDSDSSDSDTSDDDDVNNNRNMYMRSVFHATGSISNSDVNNPANIASDTSDNNISISANNAASSTATKSSNMIEMFAWDTNDSFASSSSSYSRITSPRVRTARALSRSRPSPIQTFMYPSHSHGNHPYQLPSHKNNQFRSSSRFHNNNINNSVMDYDAMSMGSASPSPSINANLAINPNSLSHISLPPPLSSGFSRSRANSLSNMSLSTPPPPTPPHHPISASFPSSSMMLSTPSSSLSLNMTSMDPLISPCRHNSKAGLNRIVNLLKVKCIFKTPSSFLLNYL